MLRPQGHICGPGRILCLLPYAEYASTELLGQPPLLAGVMALLTTPLPDLITLLTGHQGHTRADPSTEGEVLVQTIREVVPLFPSQVHLRPGALEAALRRSRSVCSTEIRYHHRPTSHDFFCPSQVLSITAPDLQRTF